MLWNFTVFILILMKTLMMKKMWMKKKGLNPNSLKLVYSKLPEWLQSKSDFTQTKKLLNDIRIDLTSGGVGCKDKKAFNDLTRLITYISNNQVKKKCH